jgi:hypothetical protein
VITVLIVGLYLLLAAGMVWRDRDDINRFGW